MAGGFKPKLSRTETHSRLNELNEPMRASVNQMLAEKGLNLKLHSLHLTSGDMNDVHEQARNMIDELLKQKGLPLRTHSVHLASDTADGPIRCCWIDGEWVCGPQCP